MDLILDACFVVHSGRLSAGSVPLLEFVDRLAKAPMYRLTNKVRTEISRHGAGDWLTAIEAAQRLAPAPNEHRQARTFRDELERKYKSQTPGIHDVGLLRLAMTSGCVLITNDHDFYRVALETHGAVLDILDVLLAGIGARILSEVDVKTALGFLAGSQPHFCPLGWKQLQATRGLTWPSGYAQLVQQRRDASTLHALFV